MDCTRRGNLLEGPVRERAWQQFILYGLNRVVCIKIG